MTQLEAFLAKQEKIIAEDREQTLIALGLTEKEYAPGNTPSYRYPEYEYQKGEKVYYRKVALKMTDEEYQLVLQKVRQVSEIEARRDAETQKKRASARIVKRWVPEFARPKPQSFAGETSAKPDDGRSKIATGLRWIAWTGFVLLLIACFILLMVSLMAEEAAPGALIGGLLGGAAIELMLFLALAEILDALAELTAIARHGYRYSERGQ